MAHEQDLDVKDAFGHSPLHIAILGTSQSGSALLPKALVHRGASIKSKTDRGDTCMELIPHDISDTLHNELRHLLKKHYCRCQCALTFRFLPIKYRRSRCTMISFVLTWFALLYVHVTLLTPQLPTNFESYTMMAIHGGLFLLVMVT